MKKVLHHIAKFKMMAILLALVVVVALLEPRFLSPSNLSNVLLQVSIEGIVATGLTLVVLTGGLDLSVGSVTALSGVIFVLCAPFGIGWAGLAALFAGSLVGLVNGLLIGPLKMNSFIVTLGAMAGVQGIALWVSRGYPLSGPGGDFEMLGGGYFLYVPLPIVFYVGVLISSQFLLAQTQWGRDLYAIGANRKAAKLADIAIANREWTAYMVCSLLAAFSGILLASRLNTGSPIIGQDLPLQAIAAIVLGGTSLYGGRGGTLQTMVGILIIGVLSNGMNLLNVSPAYQWTIKGAVLILVAGIDSVRGKVRLVSIS
ncbi:MAG: ABC transporter permease [Terriglobia bacterium]